MCLFMKTNLGNLSYIAKYKDGHIVIFASARQDVTRQFFCKQQKELLVLYFLLITQVTPTKTVITTFKYFLNWCFEEENICSFLQVTFIYR